MRWLALVGLLLACGTASGPDCCVLDAGAVDAGTDAGAIDAGAALPLWQQETLTAHNTVRATAMPVPQPALAPLTWSADMATRAQTWAARCRFSHDLSHDFGENLFASAAPSTAPEAVASWAGEAPDYTYASDTCRVPMKCGHYTQIVWRSTARVGCGSQRCAMNSPWSAFPEWTLWVCNYDPPGNFIGQKPY